MAALQVTLATRVFGRGVDFKVLDDHLLTCGGMHILATFFPSDKSEEVQIKGRTARQGDAGSFSMVLRIEQLIDCCSGLTADHLKQCIGVDAVTDGHLVKWNQEKVLYQRMNRIREETARAGLASRLKLAAEAKKAHTKVVAALRDKDKLAGLLRSNNAVGGGNVSRTLILLDITHSMSSTIEATKARVGEFFDRCQKVLEKEGIEQGFEIQLAGYSNYNVGIEQILEASTWEQKPGNLRTFLQQLGVRGGRGREAVEVGLQYALSQHTAEHPITQIVLIGDAGANTYEDIVTKREDRYGEKYWYDARSSWCPQGVSKVTAADAVTRLAQVVGRPPPIFAYFIGGRATSSFQELAVASGGKAQELAINDPKGAEMLTDAICTKVSLMML